MNRNHHIDWGGWIATFILLATPVWPLGIIMLIKQLKKAGRQQTVERRSKEASYARTAAEEVMNSVKTTIAAENHVGGKKSSSKSRKKKENKKLPNGRTLSIVGGCIAGVFGIGLLSTIGEIFSYGWYGYYAETLFTLSGFFAAGVVCLIMGNDRRRKAKRFRKYLAYIGKNQTISLAALAAAMGKKEKTVYADLQDMLDSGVLPVGYIDLAAGQLVLSDEGISDWVKPEPAEESEPVSKTMEDENAILQEIREVNDAIPDEVMSAKIDRIGEITGKILDYQRNHPSKSGQLRSFLNYYLPTTLKVLRAYAQLDAQGIEGENISAAKQRIEGMMDQVVDGFEKQLDRLFQDDALDITSDVEVLENMLRQDGLSGSGMTMTAGAESVTADTSAQQAYLDLQKVAEELNTITGDDDDQQGMTLTL